MITIFTILSNHAPSYHVYGNWPWLLKIPLLGGKFDQE